jgi:hypothetical protein
VILGLKSLTCSTSSRKHMVFVCWFCVAGATQTRMWGLTHTR